MNVVDSYFNKLQEVYSYFGFKEDWVVLPLDDRRDYYWKVYGDSHVVYGHTDEDVRDETGNHYEDEVYTQRFYDKWVYRAEEFTMIMVDTHTDGNRFLAIFDNAKEIPVEEEN